MIDGQNLVAQSPHAYSYVRFSTPGQLKGDSLRRQVEACTNYCLRTGLDLQPVNFQDLGVSAFKRQNIEKGALAAFISAVESKKIPEGSYLIIEQFDRLSRAEVTVALRLLLSLVDSGIKLVTLSDEKVWDRESVKEVTNLLVAIIYMSRANNESVAKAARLSKAWGQKKLRATETKQILTRECPRWLRVNADKTAFEIVQDRVESVQKVFAMKIGGFGAGAIVTRANKEKWPAPGKQDTWHTSLVSRVLHNRALLGEYQPCMLADGSRISDGPPILDFYPKVISEEIFLAAQAVAERRGAFPGKRDKNNRNFLQGLLRCTCGESFVRKNKASTKQPGYARYYCSARNRGLSDCPAVGALEIESAIIKAVLNVGPQFFDGEQRASDLKYRVDALQIDLSKARVSRDRYAEAIGISEGPLPILMQHLKAAQSDVDSIEKKLAGLRAEAAESGHDSVEVFAKIARLIHTPESVDERAELRENLSRVLTKCVIDPLASKITIYIRGKEVPIVTEIGTPKAVMDTLLTKIVAGMPDRFYEKMMALMNAEK